jgi:hypothetical protein
VFANARLSFNATQTHSEVVMFSIIAGHANAPFPGPTEAVHPTDQPQAADTRQVEARSQAADPTPSVPSTFAGLVPVGGFHPTARGQTPGTSQAKLGVGGFIAQQIALALERSGVKLNLEQTAAKMGVETVPDCSGGKGCTPG